ncbi:MAG: O-antigen ligase family protein, partial [Solirubrobacteraceae bacterium]
AQARHDGHRLALILLLLALGAGLLRWGQDRLGQSLVISTNARRAYVGALIAAGAALLAVVVVQFGSPQAVANRAWTSFTAAPPVVSKNLNTRLFSLSSNGRTAMWHQAWRDYREHPVLGSGAGTFEIWYLQHRTGDLKVRDAHSLYLEMLAEVGPIGLALLLIALATPLVAAVRRRRHPLVPIACGAYIAFIVHAGVDWDWEMSAVTAVGLLCGLALLIADRAGSRLSPLIRARYAFAGAAVAVALFSSVGLLGNIPASHAARAIEAGDWSRAGAEARKEIRWAPWAADGWRRLGQAELGSNRRAAAVRHLRKAIRLDPQNWDRWFDLALATTGAAQRRALERALELNPRSPEIAEFVAGLGLRGIAAPAKGSG